MFETFEHTADLGLHITADTAEQLFEQAGRGLLSIIVENLDDVEGGESRSIHLDGELEAYLLFDWLNELLYLFDSQQFVASQFRVRLTEQGLDATVTGGPLNPQRHRLDHEVKAITYHDLSLEQVKTGWEARVIVDI